MWNIYEMDFFKYARIIVNSILLFLICSCRSVGKNGEEYNSNTSKKNVTEIVTLPRDVSISLKETSFAKVIQEIGEKNGGMFALMYGLEDLPISSIHFSNASFRKVSEKLAENTGCAFQECSHYFFFYWPGYDILTQITLPRSESYTRFNQLIELVAFGYGIPLYVVFSWLGQATQTTIIADNIIADARCGQIALRDIPIIDAIEAIIKSARIAEIRSEITDDYLFLSAPSNSTLSTTLLESETLDEQRKQYLENRVTVILPAQPEEIGKVRVDLQAITLKEVLPSLSKQLGIQVVAESSLHQFPVNPCAFISVPVRTVLDLLIRQWPIPNYGYQFLSDRILIRTR